MTPEQAADLAARTLAELDRHAVLLPADRVHIAADRERVASDLAGLRGCWGDGFCTLPSHAARYADGLRRTAALYGVTE